MAHQRRNGHTKGAHKVNRRRNGHSERRVELTDEETRILVDACTMLRHSLPVYLMSSQPELRLINSVMRKLR